VERRNIGRIEDCNTMSHQPSLELNAGQFIILNSIMSDESSEIMFVQDTAGEMFAVKVFGTLRIEDFLREARALERLKEHNNIIRLHEKEARGGKYFLIMEMGGIDLAEYVQKRGTLCEEEAQEIFIQMLRALEHCHQYQICHHDLKLENFLIDPITRVVKMIDFGFSMDMSSRNHLVLPGKKKISGRYSWCTPTYASRQVLFEEDHSFEKTDIFSLGVCLYHMLTGRFPWFPEDDQLESLKNLLAEKKSPQFPTEVVFDTNCILLNNNDHQLYLSMESKDLLSRLLDHDEESRITIQQALNHPWFSLISDEFEIRIS